MWLQGVAQRSRTIQFNQSWEICMDKWPKSTRKQMHQLVTTRIRAIAWAWATSCSNSKEEFIEKRKQASRDYFDALKRQAEIIERLPPAAVSRLVEHERQFLTAIGKDISFSFLCRSKTCLYYGDNDEWIQMDDGKGKTNHIFKCPMCGKRFYPGATKDYKQGAVTANFVIAYQDANGTRWAIPTDWPPRLEMNYIQRQIEITAEERLQNIQRKYLDRLAGVDIYDDSQQVLQAYLSSQFVPAHMNHHHMTDERAAWFRRDVPSYNKGESFERVSKHGFHGNNLCLGSDVDVNAITMEQWPTAIAMMANEMARVQHQLSRSDKDGPRLLGIEI